MMAHNNNHISADSLFCPNDPRFSAGTLMRLRDGIMSEEEETAIQEHLVQCCTCKADYESLLDYEVDLLIAAHDARELQAFDPARKHAETCLARVTQKRLEKFARGDSAGEREMSDDELDTHIDACVLCRRRSVIVHRQIRHAEHLPLAYRLTEWAVQDALRTAREAIWQTLTAFARETRDLDLEKSVNVSRVGTTLTVKMSGRPLAEVRIISRDQREKEATLSTDGTGRFDDVRADEYYLRIEGSNAAFLLDVQDDAVTVNGLPIADSGTGAGTPVEELTGLLLSHARTIRRHLTDRIPEGHRHVVSVDDIMHATFTDAFLEIERVPRSEDAVGRWLWAFAKRHLVVVLSMLENRTASRVRGRLDTAAIQKLYVHMCHQSGTIPNRLHSLDATETMIKDAVVCLPEEYRDVLTEYHDGEQRLDDIARTTGRGFTAMCLMVDRGCRLMAECAVAGTVSFRAADEGQERPAYFKRN